MPIRLRPFADLAAIFTGVFLFGELASSSAQVIAPPPGTQDKIKWMLHLGTGIDSAPAIADDGTIYVTTAADPVGTNQIGRGQLCAIRADGTILWSYATDVQRCLGCSSVPTSSPSIAADGTIYFGFLDNNLYAISTNGSLKWIYATGGNIHGSPAIGGDGTIYIGSGDKNLHAVSPSGSRIWICPIGDIVNGTPTIARDGTIYIGTDIGVFASVSSAGKINWVKFGDERGVRLPAAIDEDGSIYVSTAGPHFHALNPDGSEKWKLPESNVMSGVVITGDGNIVYLRSNQILTALSRGGAERWTLPIGLYSYSSPAISGDGTIYVSASSLSVGSLIAVNPDGTLRWKAELGGYLNAASPTIGPDGTIYIGASDGNLYAFSGTSEPAKTTWPMRSHDLKHTGNQSAFRPTLTIQETAEGVLLLSGNVSAGKWVLQSSTNLQTWDTMTNSVSPPGALRILLDASSSPRFLRLRSE